MHPLLHIDFETYSDIDITKSSAYVYTMSPAFEILMVAYAFDDEPVEIFDLYNGGGELPERLLEALKNPNIIKCAHNANFERLCLKHGYDIDIPANEWECTAVKALYCGYPSSLELGALAMNLIEQKDPQGKALIRYFCVPVKSKTGLTRRHPSDDLEKWNAFLNYCIQDVETEREIHKFLSPYTIPKFEKTLYAVDQKINDRGIYVNQQLIVNAQRIDKLATAKLKNKIKDITGVENPNSPQQLIDWINTQSSKKIEKLTKLDVTKYLETADGAVKEVLKLRQKLAKTSVKKYSKTADYLIGCDRAHGLIQFYGAGRTGRWAGRGPQPHNLPRNYEKTLALARQAVLDNDYDFLEMLYEDIRDILSQLIRPMFEAKEDCLFGVSDLSAIEARVIAWLAGEHWRLEVFRTHGKIYEASASQMFGVPLESIGKTSDLRQKGKVAELALGYQGGVGALIKMGGERMGLTEKEMNTIKVKWRKTSPNIVKFWDDINNAAIKAVRNKGTIFKCGGGRLLCLYDGFMLTIELPSNRKLFYVQPEIRKGKYNKDVLHYWGLNQETKQWTLMDTYGGKLTENVVQATARDVMAEAIVDLELNYKIPVCIHVHDEIVAELPIESAEEDLQTMFKAMSKVPKWAKGLPLGADGFTTKFYLKD